MKDWFVPTISFGLFIYFMLFVILYTIKIGGNQVQLYDTSNYIAPPKTETERFLRDISENIRKSL